MTDNTADQPEFLTVSQIAKRLQMSPQTVRTWIEEGMIRGIRVRKVWRVPREDFERLLASLESGPAAPAGGWEERSQRRGFIDPEEAPAREPRMPPARSKRPDPATRAVRKRQLLERFEQAEDQWGAAMRAHRVAPPDLGFASRLRALGEAAAVEAAVCRDAAQLGLAWRPIPGAENAEPPYELRPGTGRRGPSELWDVFDTAVARFNHANAGTDAAAVADAYAEVSTAALALAEAVEAEDRAAARRARRSAGAA